MDNPPALPNAYPLRKGLFSIAVAFLAGITFTIFVLLAFAITLSLPEVEKGTLEPTPVIMAGVIGIAILLGGIILLYHIYRISREKIRIENERLVIPMPWYNTSIRLADIESIKFLPRLEITKRLTQPRFDLDKPAWLLDWAAKTSGQKVIIFSNTSATDLVEIETHSRIYHLTPETPEVFIAALASKTHLNP